jgi:hypothetical protein
MSDVDTKRIATLTTDAIRSTTDNAAKSMLETVVAAEERIGDLQQMIDVIKEKTREMRGVVEQFIEDFTKATGALTDTVNKHVNSCQAVTDLFQEHQLKILNPDAFKANGNGDRVNRNNTADEIIKQIDAAVLRTKENQ